MGLEEWHALAERLKSLGTRFVIESGIRFQGLVVEQVTMFLFDPCGNALEFKAFKKIGQLFAQCILSRILKAAKNDGLEDRAGQNQN